jgi:D-alanyl-lipoteichoic acid acyltransferase DltB (MBOAT superfamily)
VVLPVGISFYTFQAMSYTIDVYRRRIKPTRDLPLFATYVSFFPQLVAGPIERAETLLTQLAEPRRFDFSRILEGVGLVFMGLFKKLVLADRLTPFVYPKFREPLSFDGYELLLLVVMPVALYLTSGPTRTSPAATPHAGTTSPASTPLPQKSPGNCGSAGRTLSFWMRDVFLPL